MNKKTAVLLALVATVAIPGTSLADTSLSYSEVAAQQANVTPPPKPPPSVIDGIEIPFDVITGVQMDYQGFAIVKASRINVDGKVVYRLTVDNDTLADNKDSFYVRYDSDWKPLGKEVVKVITQVKVQKQAPAPQPEVKVEPPKEEKPAQVEDTTVKPRDNTDSTKPGGRGGVEPTDPAPTNED